MDRVYTIKWILWLVLLIVLIFNGLHIIKVAYVHRQRVNELNQSQQTNYKLLDRQVRLKTELENMSSMIQIEKQLEEMDMVSPE